MSDAVEMTEQEQAHAWIRKFFLPVIIGGVLALVFTFGWRYWKNHQLAEIENASLLFSDIKQKIEIGEWTLTEEQLANDLLRRYGDTVYGYFTELTLARFLFERGDIQRAKEYLKSAVARPVDILYKQLAALRLSSIYYSLGEHDQALSLIDRWSEGSSFVGQFEELRGDILIKEGKEQEARTAFQAAVLHNGGRIKSESLELKLKNVGG